MDAWTQAREDIGRILESRHAPHAARLYIGRILDTIGRILDTLERRLAREAQQRDPRPLCRTCGQGVQP
jgi:hypothetical protein